MGENAVKITIDVVYIKRRRFKNLEKFLNIREGELIRRNVKIIKELEKLEEKERLEKEKANAIILFVFANSGAGVLNYRFLPDNHTTAFFSFFDNWILSFFLLRNLNVAQ